MRMGDLLMKKIIICNNFENGYCVKFNSVCNERKACNEQYGFICLICDCGHEIPLGIAYKGTYTCFGCGAKYDENGNKV